LLKLTRKQMLLVKSWLGFGDRLQSLKMCVKYAQDTNRKIYVDWSDPVWSHGSESFYDYFKLEMPTFDPKDIPENATIFPPAWKDRIHEKVSLELIKNSELSVSGGYLKDKYSEDVVVYLCVSYRYVYNDSTFFGNVFRIIHPTILEKVRQRDARYKLGNKIGIHLRGTDRTTRVDKQYRMAGMNIRLVAAGMLNGQEFVAVSDDPEFIILWKNRYKFPVLTEVGSLGGTQGVHNQSAESIGVSKDSLNIDLLVDFCSLALCKGVISTAKDSRFAQEAQRLSPHIKRILG